MTRNEQFMGNILVDAINEQFQSQRFNVEFAFQQDTTVDTVLEDLEEALSRMGLQMIIPRNECVLAYDSNQDQNSNRNIPHTSFRVQGNGDDGVIGSTRREEGDAAVIVGTNDDNSNNRGGHHLIALTGTDCIFKAPEVEAFYDLNRRCGLSRNAIFLVVRNTDPLFFSRNTSNCQREARNSVSFDNPATVQTTTTTTTTTTAAATVTTARVEGTGVGLSVYLLPRQHQFDDSAGLLLAAPSHSATEPDETDNKYQAALATVRGMIAEEEKAILNARRQQHNPRREPHWSLQLNRQPSREEWLQAVEAEAAACDRLAAHLTYATSAAAARLGEARDALRNEVSELHERVDSVKFHVTKREALQERVNRLKLEVEAQRKKEHELLQALEKTKCGDMRRAPPPGLPLGSSTFLIHPGERSSSQHGTPLANEFGVNVSTIDTSTAGLGTAGGSNFLSPSLREEVHRALSPHRPFPVDEQQQQPQYRQQRQENAMEQLRLLAAELSHHLRSPNPSPEERHRLMAAIRTLRQQVELNQKECSFEIGESPVRSGTNKRII